MPFDPPFSGSIKPPDVPPDPSGDEWRGEPGPPGPPGPPGGIPDAPSDGAIYGRGGTTPSWTPTLPLSGGTINSTTGNALHIGVDTITTSTAATALNIQRIYNYSNGTSGVVIGTARVQSNVQGAPQDYIWNINSILNLQTTGTSAGQHVGIASTINRTSGATPSWLFFGQNNDKTGLVPAVGSQSIVGEFDLVQNGPDGNVAYYSPGVGARCGIHLVVTNFTPASWAAGHAYVLNDVVTPGNGFTYVCTVAGTSAGAPPVWPVAPGTVTDGGVTWTYGTTVASQVSRAIDIGSSGTATIGAGVLLSGKYFDALIDASTATFDTTTNPNAAAIRLPANSNIDLSGDGTAAGQNQHTLKYDSATGKLIYAVAGVAKWSVDASGNMRCAGTVTGSVAP